MTLRIQRSVESKLVVFKLAGRIRAEDVPGLLALLRSESPGSGVLMDFTDVKLVDRDAVRFLAESEAGGTGLRNCSGYTREWITQEKAS
jgi:anti-anti-sigma regulatory factor